MPHATARAARRGSESRKKTFLVTSRYDAEEFAELEEAASRAGLTRASYQRVQSLTTKPKTRSTRRAPIERELLAKLLGQLGKIGSNLNQVAAAANMGLTQTRKLDATLEALRLIVPLIMRAMGRPL
jgi:hypothetical protein